ncbi:hypothetical protein NE865_07256 [Phthorimaea operculella]|nr:hypothetical protein NE865_07256 [Phthorimaea operculella]
MAVLRQVAVCVLILQCALAVKVKVVMHSDEEASEEDIRTESSWTEHKKKDATVMPFIKHGHGKNHIDERDRDRDDREEKTTTEKSKQMHPNELIFPLIYKQDHINSMFKLGDIWYTWSTEKRTDGSKATNYYMCNDEPKHCDEIGWERTENVPKCAFQIDSLLPDDRACINNFGVEPHNAGGVCDGAEQMKVTDMVRACGPRIRSLWRFYRAGRRPANAQKPADVNSLICEDEEECFITIEYRGQQTKGSTRIRSLWRFYRAGRRPANAQKPADVNSLICEDEEECFITIEYRIHHDRITFSLHEPTRGQTFKSALKRDVTLFDDEKSTTEATVVHTHKKKHNIEEEPREQREQPKMAKKYRSRQRIKVVEGKGVVKEEKDETYRRPRKNKIKVREDVSDDISE